MPESLNFGKIFAELAGNYRKEKWSKIEYSRIHELEATENVYEKSSRNQENICLFYLVGYTWRGRKKRPKTNLGKFYLLKLQQLVCTFQIILIWGDKRSLGGVARFMYIDGIKRSSSFQRASVMGYSGNLQRGDGFWRSNTC